MRQMTCGFMRSFACWLISPNTASVCGKAAIHDERVTDHEARAGAAQPKDGRRDLLGPAEPADRLVPQYLFHGVRLFASISETIGVSIVPGHTALMQISREAYSRAALLV